MAAKSGSFRHSFAEKREKDRFYSLNEAYSEIGSFTNIIEHRTGNSWFCSFTSIRDRFVVTWKNFKHVVSNAWEMGRSDPRKIIFSAKMALALVLISLLIFAKEPIKDLSKYSLWAILTVVVVFEFSIGATLSKGFNRGLGTLSAGGLALAMAELSGLAGDWTELVVMLSIFIIAFFTTYAKLYPTMKPYKYGFRVFLLTYCFIMVSGYRTRDFSHTAVNRFLLIALGAGVSLVINICIFPIWAGEDLHNLVAKNFISVANSLEGCVNGYLNCVEYTRIPSKILTYQASDDPVYSGYRSALESTSQEETLVGFAIWEPPHGRYKMARYPWRSYLKVSGALRHCAFTVMALHGCILSEIQAPPERRKVFVSELQKIGIAGAKVLRELGNKVKHMEKLGSLDILYEVHEAAEELQKKVDRKSYLLVNSENWEIGNHQSKESLEALQDVIDINTDENRVLKFKSHSEALLDLSSIQESNTYDGRNSDILGFKYIPPSTEHVFGKQISLPSQFTNVVREEEESKTYESASVLSLATFTSLLVEFVARLQNLVDSFEELSEKAKFKERTEPLSQEETLGFWTRFCRCFNSRRKRVDLLG